MSHPDTCWRVGAIYRACQRYRKTKDWCFEQLDKLRARSAEGKVITNHSITNLADIWFRENGAGVSHMDVSREAYFQEGPYL
jgi:hypothetical protein